MGWAWLWGAGSTHGWGAAWVCGLQASQVNGSITDGMLKQAQQVVKEVVAEVHGAFWSDQVGWSWSSWQRWWGA